MQSQVSNATKRVAEREKAKQAEEPPVPAEAPPNATTAGTIINGKVSPSSSNQT